MLKAMVSRGFDPHMLASNDSNLVWAAVFSGYKTVLSHLLDMKVDCNVSAMPHDVQDVDAVKCTPLHLASIFGKKGLVEMLLEGRADVNRLDNHNKSPLDSAIRGSEAVIAELLIAGGANFTKGIASCDQSYTLKSSTKAEFQDCYSSLEILLQDPNDALMVATAKGLQHQPSQVMALSVDDVLQFCKSSTESRREILKALFCERKLKYHVQNRNGTRYILRMNTAAFGKDTRDSPPFSHTSKRLLIDMTTFRKQSSNEGSLIRKWKISFRPFAHRSWKIKDADLHASSLEATRKSQYSSVSFQIFKMICAS
jgi:hypothetical protein